MSALASGRISHGGSVMSESTMTADTTSTVVDIQGFNAAVQLITNTGTHAGSVIIQLSNDGSNWVDYAFLDSAGDIQTSLTVANGVANNDIVEVVSGAKFLRVFYDYTSGDGTIDVTVIRDMTN